MASSRWKRFAFFDRKNLSLPPPVAKDLIPSRSSNNGRVGRDNNNGSSAVDNNNLDPQFLYREDAENESSYDCTKIGSGEYFSLVSANNVSLPASLSAGSDIVGEEDGAGMVAGATKRGAGGDGAPAMSAGLFALHSSTNNNANVNNVGSPSHTGSKKGGSSSSNTMTISSQGSSSGSGNGELLLIFASSRNTSLVHCIDVTVRCTPSNPHCLAIQHQEQNHEGGGGANTVPTANNSFGIDGTNDGGYNAFASSNQTTASSSSATNRNNTNASSGAATPEELDGWRGHYNPFDSCDGFLTSGKRDSVNLLGGGGSSSAGISAKPLTASASTSSAAAGGGSASARGKRKGSEQQQRILDEHLDADIGDTSTSGAGGGGSLFGASPFASDFNPDASASAPVQKARIVGLATCSHQPISSSSSSNNNSSQSNSSVLYVAAITDTPDTLGVVVHSNPHLMLSSLPPTSKHSASKTSQYSSYYKPTTSGAINFATHGNPRCVSILPGVVCIGTDAGAVLIYVFICSSSNETNTAATSSSGSGAGSSSSGGRLSLVAEIPAPRGGNAGSNSAADHDVKNLYAVSSVELVGPQSNESNTATSGNIYHHNNIHRLFVAYRRRVQSSSSGGSPGGPGSPGGKHTSSGTTATSSGPSGGVCCYDLGGLRIPGRPLPAGSSTNAPVVSARYDMDGRDVGTSCLCDEVGLPPVPPSVWMTSKDGSSSRTNAENGGTTNHDNNNKAGTMEKMLPRFAVARSDGLHLYSPEEKVGVCPIDGNKIAICSLPPPPVVYLRRPVRPSTLENSSTGAGGGNGTDGSVTGAGASYALVATTDSKSGRDVVDIYDTANKLCGFHVLLSPGHRALRTVGIVSSPTVGSGTLLRGGRSSAVVLTSGGSIVTLTEKVTPDKVDLLTQKNLYGAAISMAFSDPQFYRPEDITALYRRYAEHLYRKGDFGAAMDQYILTIGSLESSHVIFRYLDSPKISLAVKYLEALRSAGLASPVHDELLRTCYLKLGDMESASKIILTSSSSACEAPLNPDGSEVHTVPISRTLHACADDPSEMLAAICSLEAPEAAEALVTHGVLIARHLPRETAGVVIALCDGSYSPTAMADAAAGRPTSRNDGESALKCEKYPISLFASAFMENPRLFRLILAHCRRNDCVLTPMLRRTLLELTLDEWNAANRTGDAQVQKSRHDEAINVSFQYLLIYS